MFFMTRNDIHSIPPAEMQKIHEKVKEYEKVFDEDPQSQDLFHMRSYFLGNYRYNLMRSYVIKLEEENKSQENKDFNPRNHL